MIVPLRLLGGDGDGEKVFVVVSRKQKAPPTRWPVPLALLAVIEEVTCTLDVLYLTTSYLVSSFIHLPEALRCLSFNLYRVGCFDHEPGCFQEARDAFPSQLFARSTFITSRY
jgi:hypothetical protein